MKNKNIVYGQEEKEILDAIESGKYTTLEGKDFEKENNILKMAAENTIKKMQKRKSINIRVFESDIPELKSLALQQGIPYQTLITSALHKIATRQIRL